MAIWSVMTPVVIIARWNVLPLFCLPACLSVGLSVFLSVCVSLFLSVSLFLVSSHSALRTIFVHSVYRASLCTPDNTSDVYSRQYPHSHDHVSCIHFDVSRISTPNMLNSSYVQVWNRALNASERKGAFLSTAFLFFFAKTIRILVRIFRFFKCSTLDACSPFAVA